MGGDCFAGRAPRDVDENPLSGGGRNETRAQFHTSANASLAFFAPGPSRPDLPFFGWACVASVGKTRVNCSVLPAKVAETVEGKRHVVAGWGGETLCSAIRHELHVVSLEPGSSAGLGDGRLMTRYCGG